MANEFIIRKGYKSLANSEVTGSLKVDGLVEGTSLKLSNGFTISEQSGGYAALNNWVKVDDTGFYTTTNINMDLDDTTSIFRVRGIGNATLFKVDTSQGSGKAFFYKDVRLSHEQNAGSRLELYNNRQDAGNVEIYRIAAYNSAEVAGIHFYRGSGGNSGYTKIFAKRNNASNLEEVVQFGTNDSKLSTFAGNINLTGGGTIEAPSVSGAENLTLKAAGGLDFIIDSNGNGADDQYFKVMKHTNTEIFSVKETGVATISNRLVVNDSTSQPLSSIFEGTLVVQGGTNENPIIAVTDVNTANAAAGLFHQSSTSPGFPALVINAASNGSETPLISARTNVNNTTGTGGTEVFKVDGDGDAVFTGTITGAADFKATGNNLKLHAGGNHILNIDLNGKVYPHTDNAVDLGFSTTTARFRHGYFTSNVYAGNFHGDGSNLTNVTAEWDGSHTGNASITGNLTIGGNSILGTSQDDDTVIHGSLYGTLSNSGTGLSTLAGFIVEQGAENGTKNFILPGAVENRFAGATERLTVTATKNGTAFSLSSNCFRSTNSNHSISVASSDTIVITVSGRNFQHSSGAGIAFSSRAWRAKSIEIETSTDGTTYTSRGDVSDYAKSAYYVTFSTGGTSTTHVRYILTDFATTSTRISHIFSNNYAGGDAYFVDKWYEDTKYNVLNIDSNGETDNYYLRLREDGSERLTVYENNNNVYFNGYAGNIVFRPQIAGTGNFVVSGGNTEFDASGNASFAGNAGMSSGNATGKFAVKSTGVHASYDFYNDGTSYFNGAVTIDNNLDITIGAGDVGLLVKTTDASTTPNVRFGRNNGEYVGFKVEDRANRIVFRQDETTGNHESIFDIWSSTTGNKAFLFNASDNTGANSVNWLTIENGDAAFTGNVTVAGTLTAQEFHTEFISASVIYESGSTKFGDTSDDNHNFTGSLNILGDLSVTGTVPTWNQNTTGTATTASNAMLLDGIDSSAFLRSNTADEISYAAGTAEMLKFSNSTSGGKIQIGFQQNDTDGLHHRAYFKTYKAPNTSGNATGKFDIVVRSSGGGTSADILELEAGQDAKWQGHKIWTAGNDGPTSGLAAQTAQTAVTASNAMLLDGIDSTGFVAVGGDTMTGDLILTSAGTGNNATLQIDNPSTSTFIHSIEALGANLSANQNNIIIVGKTGNTKNSGYIGYKWKADASNTNILTFGHWGSDNLMNLTADGKLGIGTESPSQKLEVNGGIYATSFVQGGTAVIKDISGITVFGSNSSTRSIRIGRDTTANDIFITGSNGNVGIGTTTPNSKLEVYGSGSTVFEVNGSQGQLFSITDSLSGSLFSVSDISGTPLLEVESDSTVTLGDYNTNTLVVTGSLVGIGTATPSAKLHIVGDVKATNFIDADNSSYSLTPSSGTSGYWTINTPNGYIQIGAMNTSHGHIYTDRPSFYFNKSILINGNAVLTTTSGQAVSVANGVYTTGDQTIAGNKTFTGGVAIKEESPTLGFADTTSGADDFFIHVNSNNFYVLADRDDSGNNEGLTGWDGAHPLQLEADTNISYTFGKRIMTADLTSSMAVSSAATATTASNAMLLDGIDSTGFVAVGGDTMTGTLTSTLNGTALTMDGGASAEGIRMTADSSTTYPVFLRSIAPSNGETSPWLYKENNTAWGIWHNNPVNSFDFTRSSNNLGIENNVGGQTNSVMIRLNNTDGSGIFKGNVTATTFVGALSGNATTATTATTATNAGNADTLDTYHASSFIRKGEDVDTTLGNSTDNRAAVLTLNHSHTSTFAAASDISDTNRVLTIQNPNGAGTDGLYTALHMQVLGNAGTTRTMGDIKFVRESGYKGNWYFTSKDTAGNWRDGLKISTDGITVEGSGSTVFDVQGSQGQLFSITDDLTGDLLNVSDISGIPILSVNASGTSSFDGVVDISEGLNVGEILNVGDGSANTTIEIKKADNNYADHIKFYNGTTRVGEIGVADNDWLRINQETAKNIYTPRYFRADGGLFVDDTNHGINSSGVLTNASLSGTYTNTLTFSTVTINTPVVGSSSKIKFANNDYIRFDDTANRFHFDVDGGTNNASVQAATFVGALTGNATTAGNATTVTNGVYTTGNQTIAGIKTFSDNISHTGLTMTDGTDIDQIKSYTKSLTLTNSWLDTGINGSELATGTYIIQVFVDNHDANGAQYDEMYSGTMSWYSNNTNSTNHDEIVLHAAGHARNNASIFLRVQRTTSADTNDLKLQITSNRNATQTASNYIFKFRRMI